MLIIKLLMDLFKKCTLIGYTSFLVGKESATNFVNKYESFICCNMEKSKILLGELIENEVRKQHIDITEFADMICCGRNNVYKIFKRSSIHVDQLARISRVLNRNFFMDLATEPSLIDIDSEEAIQDMENRRAVAQFIEVVPKVLSKLGKQPVIAFGIPLGMEDVEELPDFMLPDYGVCFSKGNYMAEKPQYKTSPLFDFKSFENTDGIRVYLMTNTLFGTRMIDVKLDFKTEEEWEKTFRFIFDTFNL